MHVSATSRWPFLAEYCIMKILIKQLFNYMFIQIVFVLWVILISIKK